MSNAGSIEQSSWATRGDGALLGRVGLTVAGTAVVGLPLCYSLAGGRNPALLIAAMITTSLIGLVMILLGILLEERLVYPSDSGGWGPQSGFGPPVRESVPAVRRIEPMVTVAQLRQTLDELQNDDAQVVVELLGTFRPVAGISVRASAGHGTHLVVLADR
jgi:hypothetical protein